MNINIKKKIYIISLMLIFFILGLCKAISESYRWEYIDKNGEIVIGAQYYDARNFNDGLVLVYTDEESGYIYI